MSIVDSQGNHHTSAGVPGAGQFATKGHSAPTGTLEADAAGPSCASCGTTPAPFRLGGVTRGYRDPNEAHYCPQCAATEAADGMQIERAPLPQQTEELLTWLVEGDDHEYVTVNAPTAERAIEDAAASFSERYDEPYAEDLLQVVAGFREDEEDPFGELTWVPGTGAAENDAYITLDEADV